MIWRVRGKTQQSVFVEKETDLCKKRKEMTTGVHFSEGHGMALLKHELVGVNLKEGGSAPKFCIFRVLKFARGSGRELKGVDMNSRERNQWWFWGQLYLPTREVCPGKGHIFPG